MLLASTWKETVLAGEGSQCHVGSFRVNAYLEKGVRKNLATKNTGSPLSKRKAVSRLMVLEKEDGTVSFRRRGKERRSRNRSVARLPKEKRGDRNIFTRRRPNRTGISQKKKKGRDDKEDKHVVYKGKREGFWLGGSGSLEKGTLETRVSAQKGASN